MSHCCRDNNIPVKQPGPQLHGTGLSYTETTNPNFQEAYPNVLANLPSRTFAKVEPSDQLVEFYPVVRKGPNYLKHCTGWLSKHEKPASIRDCIWKYTSGKQWFCTTINMALGTDSPTLEKYGEYIKHLKYSIGMSPMHYTGTVFRGVDMSPNEIAAYESKDIFFIPSFTSTSKTHGFSKNTLFHVEISPEWSKLCVEVTPEFTAYPAEDEILFSCYNLYQYIRTEKSNGQKIIKLRLKDYEKHFDYHTNTILN